MRLEKSMHTSSIMSTSIISDREEGEKIELTCPLKKLTRSCPACSREKKKEGEKKVMEA